MLLELVLGKPLAPVFVIAILEFILGVYSIALLFNAENKILKVVYILSTLLWIVLGIINLLGL